MTEKIDGWRRLPENQLRGSGIPIPQKMHKSAKSRKIRRGPARRKRAVKSRLFPLFCSFFTRREKLSLASGDFLCYNKAVMKLSDKKAALSELARLYPDARPALHYGSAYELLVAVILSAQCTDERVNLVTEKLFAEHSTPASMCLLSQEELEKYIFSCGLYKSKAEHILSASRDILDRFGGEIPKTVKELKSLAGVGQKTANVVYSVAFGGDAIAVDTHVFRVSNRLGLAKGKTPAEVEKGLHRAVPKKDWSKAHHWLIYHGRRVCHSRKPDCADCTLSPFCDFFAENARKK